MYTADQIAVKQWQITNVSRQECGNCDHWMTSSCKSEKEHGIKSAASHACRDFKLSCTSQRLCAIWQAQLDETIAAVNVVEGEEMTSLEALRKAGWSYSVGYCQHMGGYDARCWRELKKIDGVVYPIKIDGVSKYRESHIAGGDTEEKAVAALFRKLKKAAAEAGGERPEQPLRREVKRDRQHISATPGSISSS